MHGFEKALVRRPIAWAIALALAVALALHGAANAAIADWTIPWEEGIYCTVGDYDINYRQHMTSKGGKAIDFLYGIPIPLYAPTDGTIVALQDWHDPNGYVGCEDGYGYGNFVAIATDDGYGLIMAHFSSIDAALSERVRQGNWTVKRGERLGDMGSSGNSSCIHLHFEVITDRQTLGTAFGMQAGDFVTGRTIDGGMPHVHDYVAYMRAEHQPKGHRVVYICATCNQSDGITHDTWATRSSCAECKKRAK